MKTRQWCTVLLTVVVAAVIAGCGERPQVVEYKKGQYQGKTDARPWDSAQFKGDKQAWELALRQRNQTQNEYQRTQ